MSGPDTERHQGGASGWFVRLNSFAMSQNRRIGGSAANKDIQRKITVRLNSFAMSQNRWIGGSVAHKNLAGL